MRLAKRWLRSADFSREAAKVAKKSIADIKPSRLRGFA
jgi:hypothetical protein